MSFLRSLFRRQYIGTVTAISGIMNGQGEHTHSKKGRWVLTIGPFGRRVARLHGDPGASGSANNIKALVAAWKSGGPLPPLDMDTQERPAATVLRLVK